MKSLFCCFIENFTSIERFNLPCGWVEIKWGKRTNLFRNFTMFDDNQRSLIQVPEGKTRPHFHRSLWLKSRRKTGGEGRPERKTKDRKSLSGRASSTIWTLKKSNNSGITRWWRLCSRFVLFGLRLLFQYSDMSDLTFTSFKKCRILSFPMQTFYNILPFIV